MLIERGPKQYKVSIVALFLVLSLSESIVDYMIQSGYGGKGILKIRLAFVALHEDRIYMSVSSRDQHQS